MRVPRNRCLTPYLPFSCPVGTTADHPFWSEDRQEFIPASALRPGERLRTADGRITHVPQLTPRGPPEPVYNITVHGEHVYYVSADGVLVHNSKAYGSPEFGQEVHNKFSKMVQQITGVKVAVDRTPIGKTGVDLTLKTSVRGMKDAVGISQGAFRHAELKPATATGFASFIRQLSVWRQKGMKGNVGLFMYDENKVIKYVGTF